MAENHLPKTQDHRGGRFLMCHKERKSIFSGGEKEKKIRTAYPKEKGLENSYDPVRNAAFVPLITKRGIGETSCR